MNINHLSTTLFEIKNVDPKIRNFPAPRANESKEKSMKNWKIYLLLYNHFSNQMLFIKYKNNQNNYNDNQPMTTSSYND